jgi:hypothetical protein
MSPTWIRARIRTYALLVGLGYVPKVVFSRKDWEALIPKSQHKSAYNDIAGLTYDHVVYINRENVCCRRSADDLAAHEVVHLWKPGMRHSARFRGYVRELMLGRVP